MVREVNGTLEMRGMDWKSEHGPKVYELVRGRLPERGKVLLLTFTGSRMFGWGGERYDIDARGIVACNDWWSDVHHGERLYDCTVENLPHALRRVTKYWTFQEDLSEVFYCHPDFDVATMKTFTTAEQIKFHMGSIKLQIGRLRVHQNPRTALHSYRVVLVPQNFLDTGEVVIDTLEIADGRYEQLGLLRDIYLHRINRDIDWGVVNNDLRGLLKKLEETLQTRADKPDMVRFAQWKAEVEARFPPGP